MSYQSEEHKIYRKCLFIDSPSRSVSLLMSGYTLKWPITGKLRSINLQFFFVFKTASYQISGGIKSFRLLQLSLTETAIYVKHK